MIKIYSKGSLENVTIEEFTPWPFLFEVLLGGKLHARELLEDAVDRGW
jgi:hypothetical protein